MTENLKTGEHTLIIRPGCMQDRDAIYSLLIQTDNFSESDIRIGLEVLDESLYQPEKSDYRILCALNNDQALAGYICFGPIPLTVGSFDLYWIAVRAACRRQKVGEKLLLSMETDLIREKARRVYVDTSSTPAYAEARNFYEKHHYQIAAVLKDFYREGDHKVVYMKELLREREAAR